jgi:CDP-paratose 2-epimerase
MDAYGEAFNIGGGKENSLSLLELFQFLEKKLGIMMNYKKITWRASDQKIFIADNSKITAVTSWKPKMLFETGIENMLNFLRQSNML